MLRLAAVERPVPKDDEVLVRIHATTVNRTDSAIRGGEDFVTRFGYSIATTGSPFKALRRPQQRILSSELAGARHLSGRVPPPTTPAVNHTTSRSR